MRDAISRFHLQVFQEELGVVKSTNLKAGGDKIPVTKLNRKGGCTGPTLAALRLGYAIFVIMILLTTYFD